MKLTISSGISEPVRTIRFEKLNNTFLLVKMSMDDLYFDRWVVMERQTMLIMIVAVSMSSAIYLINEFLAGMTQDQFDVFLALMREFNE